RLVLRPPALSPTSYPAHRATPDIYTLSLHDALPILVIEDLPTFHVLDPKTHLATCPKWPSWPKTHLSGRPKRHPALLHANPPDQDRKSTRLNSSHVAISYAVFCLKKKRRGGGCRAAR